MNTLNRNFRIVYVPLSRAEQSGRKPSSPRVHTKGDHVLEMRRASARLGFGTWSLSPPLVVAHTGCVLPPLARATNDRPAVMFQPSDSYTCSTIPLEHRLHVARPRWAVASTMGGADRSAYIYIRVGALCARAAYKILNEILEVH